MNRIIVEIDRDFQDIVPQYLGNRRDDIVKIRNHVEAEDYQPVRRLAHQMKGSGGGYGFDSITDIGAIMEQAAVKEDAEEILNLVLSLENYLNRVEIHYV